jgi:hypothetical protein
MPHFTHPLNYRDAEIGYVYKRIVAGDSCCVVGVSGAGKSNFVAHLVSARVRAARLPARSTWLIASLTSNTILDSDARAPYQAILAAVAEALRETLPGESEPLGAVERTRERIVEAGGELAAQRLFMDAIGAVMRREDARLAIVWDQFDRTFTSCSKVLLTTLRQVRDLYKYRLSYVVFTRELLPVLRDDAESEEFVELVHSDTFGLGQFSREDALNELRELSQRYNYAPPGGVAEALLQVSGQHGGLLRCLYIGVAQGRIAANAVGQIGLGPAPLDEDADFECQKLWKGLHKDEQRAFVVSPVPNNIEPAVRRRLVTKGVLDESGAFVAPLFGRWVARRFAPIAPPAGLRLDVAAQRAWFGSNEITQNLSPLEYRLLALLWSDEDKVFTREEILRHLYPGESENPDALRNDARADDVVRRLRDRLKLIGAEGVQIEAVRGRGYRLIEKE